MAMLEDGMNIITVKKDDLLEALRKNMESHRATFLKAQEGYKITVIEELESMLKDAREGKSYRTSVHLEAPSDHTRDYSRIIKMMEMSVDKEIKISDTQFAHYVLDEWSWQQHFRATSSAYAGKVR